MENFPSAVEILAKAIASDCDKFRAALIKQAEEHDTYAELTRHAGARSGAIASKNACLRAYDIAGDHRMNPDHKAYLLCSETGPAVIALNIACKLQGLPAHVRTQAAIGLDRN
jgi:hypothetical protein